MTDFDGQVNGFPGFSPIPEDDDPRKPEIIPVVFNNFPGPGELEVYISSAVGLSVPEYQAISKQPENSSSNVESKTLPISNRQTSVLPYAILECDGSEVSTYFTAFRIKESLDWRAWYSWKFDIARPTDLKIRLYARNQNFHYKGSQDTLLGYAKMNPVFADGSHQMEWLPIKNGTGKLLVKSNYKLNRTSHFETWRRKRIIGDCRFELLYKVRNSSTMRFYASVRIQKVDISPHCDVVQPFLSPINTIPFIAPLKIIAQTRSYICLYWPFVPGGPLFYHLQQALRFSTDRARLYAAEILIALEQLHEIDPSYYELKPRNILLDSVGHIVLFDLGFLHLQKSNTADETTDLRCDNMMDFLAPELLSGQILTSTVTTASKWWTLGSFLFEMLTGLPPFYDKDTERRRDNILSKPPEYSKYLSASAQDLLNKLLSRKPEDRLGANGASEIKAHPFFDGLDWERVAWREYEPAFKPHEYEMAFAQKKHRPVPEIPVDDLFKAWSYNTPPIIKEQAAVVESSPAKEQAAVVESSPAIKEQAAVVESSPAIKEQAAVVESSPAIKEQAAVVESSPAIKEQAAIVKSHESASEKKEDWELVWQREDQKFYFYNHSTKIRKPIFPSKGEKARMLHNSAACVRDVLNTNVDTSLPDAAQCQEALEAVLENQYTHLLPALLKEYNIDLNIQFRHETPIEYMTELEDIETVRLFLESGADANLNHSYTMGGRPLLTAVKKGNQELTELLVQKTDRIPCTRALAYAVSKKDVPIVKILLANGVKCDFEDSDRPAGDSTSVVDWDLDMGCTFGLVSEPDEYIPPLVRAVALGDLHLVQLLLDHGADANVGYHDLRNSLPDTIDISERFNMRCGRPIQLAMELRHQDVVQLLLSYGADIDRPQPVWRYHHCDMIPREAHHEITAQLRSVAASIAV